MQDRSKEVVSLDIQQILAVLPHRFPFVLVDRVIELQAGRSARGTKAVAYSEPWFQGHSPQHATMPGVLVLEALSQLATILAYASEPFDRGTSHLYLLGIDKAKLRRAAVPGDLIDLRVEVLHHASNVWSFKAEANVEGALCAEAELLASVVERKS